MSAGTSIFLVAAGILVAIACLLFAAIIDAAAVRGKQEKGRDMSKEDIAKALADRLEEAAPTNLPASTRGIPGGAIDWDKFAAAIIEAVEELRGADSEEQAEETVLQRVDDDA